MSITHRVPGKDVAVEPTVLVGLGAVVAVAALVQGSTGVGFALVAAPAASLLLGPAAGIVIVLQLAFVIDVAVWWTQRHHVDLRTVRTYAIAAASAVPAAVAALAFVPAKVLVLTAAAVALVGAGLFASDAAGFGISLRPSRGSQVAAGFAAGFFGLTTGMSGPPVAIESASRHRSAVAMRATLAAFFAIVDGVAVVVRGGSVQWPYTAGLAVVVVVCAAAASAVAHRVPSAHLRWGVVAVVTVSALVAVTGVLAS